LRQVVFDGEAPGASLFAKICAIAARSVSAMA
jgi:hypothetical protein